MPYAVRKRGKQWIVYNTATGKPKGSHPTKKKAQAHMRALYTHEPKTKKRK